MVESVEVRSPKANAQDKKRRGKSKGVPIDRLCRLAYTSASAFTGSSIAARTPTNAEDEPLPAGDAERNLHSAKQQS
jgi:hypothetical protein